MELLLEMQREHAEEVAELRAQIEALSRFAGGTETFGWSHGDGPVRMIPVDEGLCYVDRVAGEFAGNGEWYEIDQNEGFWRLRANSNRHSAGNRLYVRARCWRFPSAAGRG